MSLTSSLVRFYTSSCERIKEVVDVAMSTQLGESSDSLEAVQGLLTRVQSTPDGVAFYVLKLGASSLGDGDERDADEFVCVGHIVDVDDIRTTIKESSGSSKIEPPSYYEVVLGEKLSAEHAAWLQVPRDQSFLIECLKLWDCVPARVAIAQYELHHFATQWKWSKGWDSHADAQLMMSQLDANQWPEVFPYFWRYLGAKSFIPIFLRAAAQKFLRIFESKERYKEYKKNGSRVFRAEAAVLRDLPSLIAFDKNYDQIAGAHVVRQVAVRLGAGPDDNFNSFVLLMPNGRQKFFSERCAGFNEHCTEVPAFINLTQVYQYWHVLETGMTPGALVSIQTAAMYDEERKEERALQMVTAWGEMVRRLRFDFHCDKLYQDSKGRLRGCRTMIFHWEIVADLVPVMFGNRDRKVLDVDLLDPIVVSHCNKHFKQVQVLHAQEDPRVVKPVQGADQSATAEDLLSGLRGSDSELRKLFQHNAGGINSSQNGQRSNSLVASLIAGLRDRAKVVTDKPTAETLERGAELEGLMVTRCVQHNNKVYFIFNHVNGSEWKISESASKKERLGVKALVAAYVQWHQEEYGMTVKESCDLLPSDSSGSDYVQSDSSEDALDEELHKPVVRPGSLIQISDDESVEALLYGDDVAGFEDGDTLDGSARQIDLAHTLMFENGWGEYDVYRCPAVWDKSLVDEVVQTGSAGLKKLVRKGKVPMHSAQIKQLINKHCLVMVPHFSDPDMLENMDPEERRDSYFGNVCTITGEAVESSFDFLVLRCKAVFQKGTQLDLPAEYLFPDHARMVKHLTEDLDGVSCAVGISAAEKFKRMDSHNLSGVHVSQYRVRKHATDLANDQDDELASALLSYSKEGGRDVLEEAECRDFMRKEKKALQRPASSEEDDGQTGVKVRPVPSRKKKAMKKALPAVEESSSSEEEPPQKKKGSKKALPDSVLPSSSEEESGSDDEEAEIARFLKSMAPQDEREPLPKVMVKHGFSRCLLLHCEKILTPGQHQCSCGCMSKDNCVCEFCGTTYDPQDALKCARCRKILPHDFRAYENQRQQDQLAESLGAEKRSTEHAKAKKTEQQHHDDNIMHMMLDNAGVGAPRAFSGMKGCNQVQVNLERMSKAASRDFTMQKAMIPGTNQKVTHDLISHLSKQQYGMLGQGASVWQFVPCADDWSSDLHYDSDKDKEAMLTADQLKKLRTVKLSEEIFQRTISNFGKTMIKVSGRTYKEQLDKMAATLVAYRESHLPKDRNEMVPLSMMLDIIDALHQQRADYVATAVQLVGRNGFEAVEALEMLRTEHPLVVMPKSMQLTDVPRCEIMRLCSQHRHNLTGDNFPEVYDQCGCQFSGYIKQLLRSVANGKSVRDCVLAYGPDPLKTTNQTGSRGSGAESGYEADDNSSSAPKGNDAKNKKQRGKKATGLKKKRGDERKKQEKKKLEKAKSGAPEKVKYHQYVRIGSKGFSQNWVPVAHRHTTDLCKDAGQPRLCSRALSAKGCPYDPKAPNAIQGQCDFEHEFDKDKLNAAAIQKYPVLEGFLVAKFGGLHDLSNDDRWPEEAKSEKKLGPKILECVQQRLKAYKESQDATDSDDDEVGRRPIPVGGIVYPEDDPEKQPAAQRTQPRSGLERSDPAMTVLAQTAATVAQDNRVLFSHQTPSLAEGEVDIAVSLKKVTSAVTHLGEEPVIKNFELRLLSAATATDLARTYVFHVHDVGETIGMETKRCEFVSASATNRVQGGKEAVLAGYRDSSNAYLHSEDGGLQGSGSRSGEILTHTLANLEKLSPKADLIKLENSSVTAALSESSEVAPFISSVLSQPFAAAHAEGKIFVDQEGRVSWHVGVPVGCVDGEDLKHVPVVWRFYDDHHAFGATLKEIVIGEQSTVYNESLTTISQEHWGGIYLDELKIITGKAQLAFPVTYFACKTVEQTISRNVLAMPSFITQPQEANDVGGALLDLKTGRGKVRLSAGEISIMLLTVAGAMFSPEDGFSKARNPECFFNAAVHSSGAKFHERLISQNADLVSSVGIEPMHSDQAGEEVTKPWDSDDADLSDDNEDGYLDLHSLHPSLHFARGAGLRHDKWYVLRERVETRWCFQLAMRLFNLMRQFLPVMEEWRTFNEFDYEDSVQLNNAYKQSGALSMPHGNSTAKGKLWQEVTLQIEVSKEDAFVLLRRAMRAQIQHQMQQFSGRQSSTDPGMDWLNEHGEIMQETVRWAEVAWADEDPGSRVKMLEKLYRAMKQHGRAHPNVYAENVEAHFSDLPSELKETLEDTMRYGVHTGIPTPEQTTHSRSSMTARHNSAAVWKHLRKFVANGWLRAYPPSVAWGLAHWKLRMSSTHFVESSAYKKERLVSDLGNPGDAGADQDANSLSPDVAYSQVQADYIDDVAEAICQDLTTKNITEELLAAIKADIKAAFMQVPLHVNDIGSLCMEWEGWHFVFVRTPFGWKWATHTFSVFTAALKSKITNFNKNGFHKLEVMQPWRRMSRRYAMLARVQSMLGKGLARDTFLKRAGLVWSSFLAFCYVDDAYGLSELLGGRPQTLARVLSTAGSLLMGFGAWSISKVEEDGFYAWLHKFTGIVIDTSDAPRIFVSFTIDRLEKMITLLQAINWSADTLPLGQVQSIFGNLMWITKVYTMLKAWMAPWRRCMQGVSTTDVAPDYRVSSAMPRESNALAQKKLKKDTSMLIQWLQHMCQQKREHGEHHKNCMMPISVLRDSETCYDLDDDLDKVAIGGDASGTCWSVLCHSLRQAMVIYMPPAMQQAIKQAGKMPADAPLRRFLISIAEHMVAAFALLQWGAAWQEQGYKAAFYHTDNQNSFAWAKSGFASNDIAQELCRLIGALQACFTLHLLPVWWPSALNLMADILSRMLDENGNVIMPMSEKFDKLNNSLKQPYKLVLPNADVKNLLRWIETVKHAFDELSEITLFSDSKFLGGLRGASVIDVTTGIPLCVSHMRSTAKIKGISMRDQLHNFREAFTLEDARARCRMVSHKAFSFASMGCGACIGLMGVLRSGLWKPRWAAEVILCKNQMWRSDTQTLAFFNVLLIKLSAALWCNMIEVTMPCIDYSLSGPKKGEYGQTGWLWLYAIRLAIAIAPDVIFSEMADNALQVDGGRIVKRIIAALRVSYNVVAKIVKVWDYGDGSRRQRLIIVSIRKDKDSANSYTMPPPVYTAKNPHTVRDTAVPDDEVPESHRKYEPLTIWYARKAPVPGQMQRIGRLAPGMGLSWSPHLCFSYEGTNNGQTRFGGGGTKPPYDWEWGMPLLWRRLTVVVEFYRMMSLSTTVHSFHAEYCTDKSEDGLAAFLKDCVNQGWPAASAFCLALSVGQYLFAAVRLALHTVEPLTQDEFDAATITLPAEIATTIADGSLGADLTNWSHLFLDKQQVWRPCELLQKVNESQVRLRFRCGVKVKDTCRLMPFEASMVDQCVETAVSATQPLSPKLPKAAASTGKVTFANKVVSSHKTYESEADFMRKTPGAMTKKETPTSVRLTAQSAGELLATHNEEVASAVRANRLHKRLDGMQPDGYCNQTWQQIGAGSPAANKDAHFDSEPTHLWLCHDGKFKQCTLLSQPSENSAEVRLHSGDIQVVEARKLWPWVLGLHDFQAAPTAENGNEAHMAAAEISFAQLMRKRGTSVTATAAHAGTHMFLDALNFWRPCTLKHMISFDICVVTTSIGDIEVAPALLAKYAATALHTHISDAVSFDMFAVTQGVQSCTVVGSDPQWPCDSYDEYDSGVPGSESESDDEDVNDDDDAGLLRHSDLTRPRAGRKLPAQIKTTTAQRADAHVPTEKECLQALQAEQTDWASPLHPNFSNKKVRQLLSGMMRHNEWAQMHYFLCMLNEIELESGTNKVYNDGVRHFMEFLERYPLESKFTGAHRATGALFEPAVWQVSQVEAILIDFVLHEAGVRGNGWSSVRGKLFGIRHLNIRSNLGNPLLGKYRLNQVMRALRKYNGPKAGKRPTSKAMILALERLLDHENNEIDQVLLTAALASFMFMMRSAEYCAKLSRGRFDMDRVLRVKDVRFYIKGREIKCSKDFNKADEARITFGKTKTTEGGEVRGHFATKHACCVVKALAKMLQERDTSDGDAPLFAWPAGSGMRGEGVRYIDMVDLIKSAATACGLEASEYSSHSQRRGGASAMLLSGAMTMEECRIYGRWRSLSSLKLYIEPALGALARGSQDRFLLDAKTSKRLMSATVNHELLQMEPPRERDFMRMRAAKAADKMRQARSH